MASHLPDHPVSGFDVETTHTFPRVSDLTWTVPIGYEAPRIREGWRPISCRSCRQLVLFVSTRAGKKAPLNADGTSHFSTCTDADRWRS